ncbi:MAG: DinB family protein [Blastocatellia bacterium]|nr:DinB family protein [Blastocatellia bacterium]
MRNRIKTVRCLIAALAICATLSLATFAQQQAPKELPTDRVAGMVAEWTRAKDYTREYIDAMPEDALGFKPTPEVRSFAEQMLHLAGGNYFFIKNAFGVDGPAEVKEIEKRDDLKKSRAALNKAVADSYDFMIAQIKGLKSAKLDEPVTMFGMKMPLGVGILKAFEHQTHHRGQTTVYIRLKGVKPPNERLF